MIENFYRLGKALEGQDENSDYFSPWQNPFPTGDNDKLKVIIFPIEQGKVGTYDVEPFKKHLLKEYLYRKPNGSNGAPLVPTSPFYPTNIPDEERAKLKAKAKHEADVKKLMSRLVRAINTNQALYFPEKGAKEDGLAEVEKQLINFQGDTGNRYLLTFKINGSWLGDFDENLQLFFNEAYDKYRAKSSAKNKVCAITYEEAEEVWGRVDTLGFTVDAKTFSRSGFDDSKSYKMFPVSAEAVRLLEGAKEYAMEKLRRRFANLEYIILPHFLQESEISMRHSIKTIEKEDGEYDVLDFSEVLFSNERVFHSLAKRDENLKEGIFYDILFFQRSQAQLALKLHLTDLLPSRFADIFSAKQLIEKRYQALNRLVNKKGEITPFAVTFNKIKSYFSQVIRSETVFQPFFFKLVEAIFYGQTVDEQTILAAFQKQIQTDFKQRNERSYQYQYIITIKEAFAFWHFFALLGLFTSKPTITMDQNPIPRTLESFIDAHPTFFQEPYKKGAFYMGCLVSVLTNVQYNKLKSEPFLERLNSLNFDDAELRKLFPILLDKMRQYEDINKYYYNYVQELKAAITPILMTPTDLSRTEISFAFTAGMVMQKEFVKAKSESKKEEQSSLDQ